MATNTMQPSITELERQLLAITDNPPARPTKSDWGKLVSLRGEILKLQDERGLGLSNPERVTRQRLSDVVAREAVRQKEIYAHSGNRWTA